MTDDGNAIATKGVVVVSMNYRVNVFGWFAHPELTQESPHHSSGNYGSLDQLVGIQWVRNNVAHFGGDPSKVTIWGESDGSRSVNFLAASPLARGLFRGAIAESHTTFGRMPTLAEAEANGVKFANAIGRRSLTELRAVSARDLLDASIRNPEGLNGAIVDGWFLQDIYTTYAQGQQNDIALITGGTNGQGGNIVGIGAGCAAGSAPPDSRISYTEWAKRTFGARADALLKLYPATNDAQAKQAYHNVYRISTSPVTAPGPGCSRVQGNRRRGYTCSATCRHTRTTTGTTRVRRSEPCIFPRSFTCSITFHEGLPVD